MTLPPELAALFRRDLTRLRQEIEAFSTETDIWKLVPGVSNSAGHLTMHLEGNLREYIGRQIGGVAYTRNRPAEFQGPPKPRPELLAGIDLVLSLVPGVVAALNEEHLAAPFPERVLGPELSTQQFLIHLYGHLAYHLGQIDYLRRVLTTAGAIDLARLPG